MVWNSNVYQVEGYLLDYELEADLQILHPYIISADIFSQSRLK